MSVAERLGLADPESPLLAAAGIAWTGWYVAVADLGAVADLRDLPGWTRASSRADADRVLRAVASLTATEPEAVTALAWALLPGAEKIARGLADLHDDIDGIVAGQLWIEASRAHELGGRGIAAAVLRRVRQRVCAELGVGDAGRRCDRVWAESTHLDPGYDVAAADDSSASEVDPFWEVTGMMTEAIEAKAIHVFDAWLLEELAWLAARLEVPGHRGRSGLMAPAVIEMLAGTVHLSPRAIRRRATTALDRWAEFLRVRDDPDTYPAWRAQHRDRTVTPAEEMQLVLNEDGPAEFFRTRDLPADAWAPDVRPERRPPATA